MSDGPTNLDALKEEIQAAENEREDLDDLIVVLRGELAVARGEVELEDADIAELEAMARGAGEE